MPTGSCAQPSSFQRSRSLASKFSEWLSYARLSACIRCPPVSPAIGSSRKSCVSELPRTNAAQSAKTTQDAGVAQRHLPAASLTRRRRA